MGEARTRSQGVRPIPNPLHPRILDSRRGEREREREREREQYQPLLGIDGRLETERIIVGGPDPTARPLHGRDRRLRRRLHLHIDRQRPDRGALEKEKERDTQRTITIIRTLG